MTLQERWKFVGNRRNRRYHSTFCSGCKGISPESRIIFQAAAEAEEAGYRACRCPSVVADEDTFLYHRINCSRADPWALVRYTILRSREVAERKGYDSCCWCTGEDLAGSDDYAYIPSPAEALRRVLENDARMLHDALARNNLLPCSSHVQSRAAVTSSKTLRERAIASRSIAPPQLSLLESSKEPPRRRSPPNEGRESVERTLTEDLQADWKSLTLDGDVKAGLRLLAELAGLANLGIAGVALLSLASGVLAPVGLTLGGGVLAEVAKLAYDKYDRLKTTDRKKVAKALKWLNKILVPQMP